jgi:2-iminobutanoate/2-iminopropanoate deaminase
MSKEIISTDKAPKAIGPYSQAVRIDNLLFTSGQIPLDAITGQLEENDITKQSIKVMENLKALLESQKLDFSNVVKTTCFLSDMANFASFNEVYADYFTDTPPARSTVAVKSLPKDALVEVELIACFK